jgi:hypothetical protein
LVPSSLDALEDTAIGLAYLGKRSLMQHHTFAASYRRPISALKVLRKLMISCFYCQLLADFKLEERTEKQPAN